MEKFMATSKRYVKIPNDIKVTDPSGKKVFIQDKDNTTQELTFSMNQFVQHILNDDKFTTSGAKIRTSIKIDLAFKDKNVDDYAELNEDDWKLLQEVAENPTHGYPSITDGNGKILFSISKQLVPFLDSLEDPVNKI